MRSPLPPFGHGLDLTAVLDIATLPDAMRSTLDAHGLAGPRDRQLILVCHVGRAFWEALRASGIDAAHPVDDFTTQVVERWRATHLAGVSSRILYPGDSLPIGLQALGALAGIHRATPFRIGIDPTWGTWFAYRAVVLADTDFAPTEPSTEPSPCDGCVHRVCESRCPAGAVSRDALDLRRCITYRRQPGSPCRSTCLARTSCPVGAEHRYTDEQLHYHYGCSMRTIEAMVPEP